MSADSFGLKLYEISPNESTREIQIDTSEIDEHGISIGRSPDADIHIGVLGRKVLIPHPVDWKRAKGDKVSISSLISRTQATIYRDPAGRLRVRDGNGNESQFGIREGATNRKIERPWLLSPGAFVRLTPEGGGYRCWLEWSAAQCDADAPTIGYSQWQNENLQEEIEAQRAIVTALEKGLKSLKEESHSRDRKHDRLIKQLGQALIVVSVVGIFCGLFLLGIDIKQLNEIVEIALLVTGVMGAGAAWKIKQG